MKPDLVYIQKQRVPLFSFSVHSNNLHFFLFTDVYLTVKVLLYYDLKSSQISYNCSVMTGFRFTCGSHLKG